MPWCLLAGSWDTTLLEPYKVPASSSPTWLMREQRLAQVKTNQSINLHHSAMVPSGLTDAGT